MKVICFGAFLNTFLSRKDRNFILINSKISLQLKKCIAIPSVTS